MWNECHCSGLSGKNAEQQAQSKLGELLKDASEGRTPETGATVATLMDEYASVAEWDVSTRQTNEGFIRRTIKPALGPMQVRKVRGLVLNTTAAAPGAASMSATR